MERPLNYGEQVAVLGMGCSDRISGIVAEALQAAFNAGIETGGLRVTELEGRLHRRNERIKVLQKCQDRLRELDRDAQHRSEACVPVLTTDEADD